MSAETAASSDLSPSAPDALEARRAALDERIQAICARLTRDAVALGLPPDAGPVPARAQYSLSRDPFSGLASLSARWAPESNGHRGGNMVFHPDDSFFAEYDVLLPHPDKPGWFVEAVTAWGRGDAIKGEARLLPLPEEADVVHTLPTDVRLIVAHKHHTSGRVRFLRFDSTVLSFAPLPPGAWAIDEPAPTPTVLHHPATLARHAENALGLPTDGLRIDTEFGLTLSADGQTMTLRLAECAGIEPPFAAAEAHGARFAQITDSRDLPLIERELMRAVYEHLLG